MIRQRIVIAALSLSAVGFVGILQREGYSDTAIIPATGDATVQWPGGALQRVRGTGAVGALVFVRDGLIEGAAPALVFEVIEI